MQGDGDTRASKPLSPQLVTLMNQKAMVQGDPIFVRIFKRESELEVWKRDRTGRYALLKTYPMCRWSGQLGPKKRDGDRQAPEGIYTVSPEQMNPNSLYYLSFNLGYPNRMEQAQGYTGSALMVHGACTSAGCYAMTDDGISDIYGLAREAFAGGQKSFQVQSLPFRMTAENMALHRGNANIAFWRNLKEGSDHFDVTAQPPRVAACGRRYVFNATAGSGPFDPAAPCPSYEIEPDIAPLISAKNKKDEARTAELIAAGLPASTARYADGGMHSSFRALLAKIGPEKLQALTSGRVELGQPEAALADPFVASEDAAIATGSLNRH